ncbi:hypothetical protein LEL_08785 [Akanthomyces lecanii RCEF 1005]|uniref:FAR-17a/AIG1-like protein n=1 Tax=Akanthomyces lecanii RCEF 1005 TaxID=1081108 RepID=A0A168DTX3_CORDF|nr:hypothetical protein LEL_08785 [Akanthomyces lecanii RCEF 1005]
MARDTTPLLAGHIGHLPGPNIVHDHIPQRFLVKLRSLVLAYLTSTGIMTYYYKYIEFRDHPIWFLLFHFGTLSFILTHLWTVITLAWTFTHLYYPEIKRGIRDVRTVERDVGNIEHWIVQKLSLPSNLGSPRKQFAFHMFYSTTTVFAFMNLVTWIITRQHNPHATSAEGPFTHLFGVGWFKSFALFNLYFTPAIVMIIETLFFNSIKRPQSMGSHLLGLSSLSGLYLGWAALGGYLTGCYPFYWLNPDFVGSKEAVAAYCMGFVALAPLMFVLKQGFIGLREGLTNAPAGMREVASG